MLWPNRSLTRLKPSMSNRSSQADPPSRASRSALELERTMEGARVRNASQSVTVRVAAVMPAGQYLREDALGLGKESHLVNLLVALRRRIRPSEGCTG